MAHNEEEYQKTFPQPELDAAFTKGRFVNKVVIVTGGTSGIGRATAERFGNDGATVAILARNADRGDVVAAELRRGGKNIRFYQCDVTQKDQCKQAVQQVAKDNGGKIHFLVNNHAVFNSSSSDVGVGIRSSENIVDVPMEKLQNILCGNIVGTANMVQACYPFMKNDGNNCAIVNILSIRAHNACLESSPYSTAKAGLAMFTKCAALDLASTGIRVNSVSPGYIWTPRLQTVMGNRETAEKIVLRLHISRRVIEAAGVASAVAFLCSQDAMYIDGADIPVDCGNSAMGPEGLGDH